VIGCEDELGTYHEDVEHLVRLGQDPGFEIVGFEKLLKDFVELATLSLSIQVADIVCTGLYVCVVSSKHIPELVQCSLPDHFCFLLHLRCSQDLVDYLGVLLEETEQYDEGLNNAIDPDEDNQSDSELVQQAWRGLFVYIEGQGQFFEFPEGELLQHIDVCAVGCVFFMVVVDETVLRMGLLLAPFDG